MPPPQWHNTSEIVRGFSSGTHCSQCGLFAGIWLVIGILVISNLAVKTALHTTRPLNNVLSFFQCFHMEPFLHSSNIMTETTGMTILIITVIQWSLWRTGMITKSFLKDVNCLSPVCCGLWIKILLYFRIETRIKNKHVPYILQEQVNRLQNHKGFF